MITRIVLNNWLRFRGEHTVELAATIYGLTASRPGDVESSNWAGKSSFCESIPFALYGWHRKRTEDEWITNGEAEGSVSLVLDNGVRIVRSRKRGKSTQLELHQASGVAKGDEAQWAIDKQIGLSREDFFATRYLEQKSADRFVKARPADRAAMVGSWIGLEPLQLAHAYAIARLGEVAAQLQVSKTRLESVNIGLETIDGSFGGIPSNKLVEAAKQSVLAAQVKLETFRETEKSARQLVEELVLETKSVADRKRHAGLLTKIESMGDGAPTPRRLAALKKTLGDADVAVQIANEAVSTAREERGRLGVVAGARFDGSCPAAPGFICPVRAQVIQEAKRTLVAVDASKEATKNAERESISAVGWLSTAQDELRRAESVATEIRGLRQEADRLAASLPEEQHGSPDDLDKRVNVARMALGDAISGVAALFGDVRLAIDRMERTQKLVAEAGELEGRCVESARVLKVYGEAVELLGIRGAQRVISEAALVEVEQGANQMLEECGIDLSVRLSWEREGKALADACGACGQAFPKGRSIKQCSRCGAERGPKLDEKLDVILSDQSGAAEDLVGVAIQSAAARWLCERRDSNWDVAILDEIWGHLDPVIRRSLAAHVAAKLKSDGVRQAFVVAHDSATLGAMPGRIHITASEGGSSVMVLSG